MRTVRGTVRAAGALLVLALAACGAAPADGPELSVHLEQSRDSENRHLLQVVLTNDGDGPVEVVRLQLRAPGWTEVAPTARSDVLRAGGRLAFPVAYGSALCGRDGPATVVVGHRSVDGLQERELRVPDDDPLLPRLHRRECDLRELAEAVEVAFDDGAWRREGDVVTGRLLVRRLAGDAPVTVDALEGTVVFTLRPDAGLPLTLTTGRAEVPVRVTASRCDVHALVESKRSYDFPYVATLGRQPLSVTVRPDPGGVALLERLLADVCAPR